jgi:ElaB/YqjD/DUF883 family membrane-anchored ribosome-binding protein
MGETVEAIGYKADVPARFGDAVRDRIETVRGTVNDVVHGAADASSRAGSGVSDAAAGAATGAKRAVSAVAENPLGIALGALAVGFLVGLALPVSDLERERVGPVADVVVERAKKAANEAVEAGQAVVADSLQAAASTAQDRAKTIADHAFGGTAGQS